MSGVPSPGPRRRAAPPRVSSREIQKKRTTPYTSFSLVGAFGPGRAHAHARLAPSGLFKVHVPRRLTHPPSTTMVVLELPRCCHGAATVRKMRADECGSTSMRVRHPASSHLISHAP